MAAVQVIRRVAFAAAWLALAATTAGAQETPQAAGPRATGDAAARVAVPALTPVRIRIEDPVSSESSRPGDRFRISIAEDVRVGDALVIPSGAQGVGEVVHASPSGSGGKPGGLILAARTIDVDGRQVRLRSLVLSRSGSDRTAGVGVAAAAVSLLALGIHGGAIVIPAGTVADAKTAEAVELRDLATPTNSPGPVGLAVAPSKEGADAQH